jgi:hypothetical protein
VSPQILFAQEETTETDETTDLFNEVIKELDDAIENLTEEEYNEASTLQIIYNKTDANSIGSGTLTLTYQSTGDQITSMVFEINRGHGDENDYYEAVISGELKSLEDNIVYYTEYGSTWDNENSEELICCVMFYIEDSQIEVRTLRCESLNNWTYNLTFDGIYEINKVLLR